VTHSNEHAAPPAVVRPGRRRNPNWWLSAIVLAVVVIAAFSIRALTVPSQPPEPIAAPQSEISAQATAASPTQATVVAPAAVVASPTALASPAPTAFDATASVVWIGNTDGQGAYVHSAPSLSGKLGAYPDGTELRVIGPDVDAEGVHWRHVAASDGANGYISADYVVNTGPT
jgi:hypothetical protein